MLVTGQAGERAKLLIWIVNIDPRKRFAVKAVRCFICVDSRDALAVSEVNGHLLARS